MDRISKERRSENMSAIRSKDTKPEIIVRRHLSKLGLRYRCNVADLPGKPDIAIKKYKLALDVHGCFWHGHSNCNNFRLPKSNTEYWERKIRQNIERDARTKESLEAMNFHYFVVWECELVTLKISKLENFAAIYFELKNNFR